MDVICCLSFIFCGKYVRMGKIHVWDVEFIYTNPRNNSMYYIKVCLFVYFLTNTLWIAEFILFHEYNKIRFVCLYKDSTSMLLICTPQS